MINAIGAPRRWILLAAILAILEIVGAGSGPARAQIEIDIMRGSVEPMPVAVTDLYGERPEAAWLGAEIGRVIAADLERSGLFKPIDPRAFIQSAAEVQTGLRFADWRVLNAQGLVTGKVEFGNDGRLEVEFSLWDVFAGERLIGWGLRTPPEFWRRIAHKIADMIYERLTGETGYFDTRIIYIAETGAITEPIKRLAIMDQDGANLRYLTNGDNLVLTPRFSPDPDEQEITYLLYLHGKPRVYLYNVDTGQQEVLERNFPGMTFAPRFSPDGSKVVMTYAQDGNSEIYEMDLQTREIERLTNNPAIDTAPTYSPDGEYVTFESDRGGTQQIYVMRSDGRDVRRISFGNGRYGTPVWSPRGDLIAFTKSRKGTFYIGVMHPDGSGERLLAEGFLVEGPSWAPNGRVLIFTRQQVVGDGHRNELVSIDLTGYNRRVIVTPTGASDPAWSPLLP